MGEQNKFDPAHIQKYFGKLFITDNRSYYALTGDGKLTGREGIEGAEIALIAGIEDSLYKTAVSYLNKKQYKSKVELDNFIREHGQEIRRGLRLIVSLTPKSLRKFNKYGMITSPI